MKNVAAYGSQSSDGLTAAVPRPRRNRGGCVERGTAKRNNRLLTAPLLLHQDHPPYEFAYMPLNKLKNIEDYFVGCQVAEGKEAKIVGHQDKSEAQSIVREAVGP
ncbi:hypothetical protein NKJ70_27085 [Mesorhizobium sp. M0092]|uniref:hypothetical protein n=1 Tax=Mesorhizobium sp. M0092 TaxID=2956876 RepID=UPI003337CBF3